jgi:parallel beta-helix repeat protein
MIICRVVVSILALGFISTLAHAASEFFVDTHAAAGGSGTANAPFQTISDAVKAADKGGTITVKAGSYRELVTIANVKGADAPLVIRAAPGERVIVTGFDAIQGWKDEGNGLYSVTVPHRLNDLYVGGAHQRIARFPDAQSLWAKITQVDAAATTVQLSDFPAQIPAGEEKSLCLCDVGTAGNVDVQMRLKSVDPTTKSVTFDPLKGTPPRVGDPVILFNAPSFIKFPGEWACQQIDDKNWKVVFRPKSPHDLQKTETRARSGIFAITASSNIVLQDLEIAGGSYHSVEATNTDNFQVKHCIVYGNGVGLYFTDCTNTLVDSCLIFSNRHGILVNSGDGFTVQGSELAMNEEDGVDIAGRGLQDPKAPPLKNVTFRNDYIHGHLYLGHPDNTQSWGNVDGLNYENDLIMLGGNSSGQLEDCENLKITNSAMIGSDNYHFNLGLARGLHTAVYNVDVEHSTLAFAGSICINMPEGVHDVKVFHDVFLQNHSIYDGSNLTSGDNLFWAHGNPKDGLIINKRDGRMTEYSSLADWQKVDPKFEVGSQLADPQFKNVPVCLLRANGFTAPPNQVVIVKDPGKTFAVGDTVEVCGDGVGRKITAVNGQTITFDPPLPSAPFRDLVLWNWGQKTDFQIDLSSPVAGGKDQPGCNINVAAYQRGELDGTGKRSIPALPPELKAAWPNPSNLTFPYYLYLKGRFD